MFNILIVCCLHGLCFTGKYDTTHRTDVLQEISNRKFPEVTQDVKGRFLH